MKTLPPQRVQRKTPNDHGNSEGPAFRIRSKSYRRREEKAPRETAPKADGKMRLRVLGVIFAALGLTVAVRLWYLQVLDSGTFKAAAEQNQVRISRTQAPRGRILAADGTPVVDNRVSLSVGVELVRLRELDADARDDVVTRLSEILEIPVEEIEHALEFPKVNPVDPIPIADDVPIEVMARIEEYKEEFPGVVPIMRPVRVYTQPSDCAAAGDGSTAPGEGSDTPAASPPGTAECPTIAAHILGYVGETNEGDLERHDDYRLGDLIGRAGLEATYEEYLRGDGGQRKLEVDSTGRMLRVIGEKLPVQGNDLVLTLDPNVQRSAERALEAGIMKARGESDSDSGGAYNAPGGAVVVLDPRDGSVRAMASFPTYDPDQFTGGIPTDLWTQLNDPANDYPLNNRAVQGLYPPASTWKVVTAMAALGNGFVTPDTVLQAGPSFQPGKNSRAFKDWKSGGHGATDFRKSLVWSVDVYYYKLGFEMDQAGGEIMQDTARRAGFGSLTGIDLPVEKGGRVPDENWKREVHNQNPEAFPDPTWYPGDSINMSIGQGDLLVTPLQMANVYAAIANGGTLWRPHLVDSAVARDGTVVHSAPPEEIGRVPADADVLARMRDALLGVTQEGTARGTFAGFPLEQVPIGGKTGTGQVTGKQDMSWFIGFGPVDDPEYVVAVAIEEGGGGSQTAGPVVRAIFEDIYGIESEGLVDAARTD